MPLYFVAFVSSAHHSLIRAVSCGDNENTTSVASTLLLGLLQDQLVLSINGASVLDGPAELDVPSGEGFTIYGSEEERRQTGVLLTVLISIE